MRVAIDLQGAQCGSRARGIGRYSKALALAMAQTRGDHQLNILLSGNFPDAVEELRDALAPFLAPEDIRVWYGPGRQTSRDPDDTQRLAAAERIRAEVIHAVRPDLLLVSSMFEGFADDAVTAFPADRMAPPTISICYDFIPLSRPKVYLGSESAQNWYYRRLLQLMHQEGVLCISQSAQREVAAELGLIGDRAIDIQAGVAPGFRPAKPGDEAGEAVLLRYGLMPGYVLCVGAVEERKNLTGLIRAYGTLPVALRQKHPLVATGWNDEHGLPPLRKLAAQVGLSNGELRLLTDFVPDRDLPALYRGSAVAICPSLHEGFGLPVLEAMACGVAALCSNVSSLPEVMDRTDAQFDPHDPASIAHRLRTTLEDDTFRSDLAAYGLDRAAQFTWAKTAQRAWQAAERFAAGATWPATQRKLRLGVIASLEGNVAPLRRMLLALARWYEVEILSDDPAPADPMLRANFRVRPDATLGTNPVDRLVYYPGDDASLAARSLRLLDCYPGVVLIGPGSFTDALRHATGRDAESLPSLLLEVHGWRAVVAWRDDGNSALDQFRFDAALQARAIAVLDTSLDPQALHDAIEAAYDRSPVAAFDACMASLQKDSLALPEIAWAVNRSFRPVNPPTLLLDVSTIAIQDAGTGIQRVIRETVRQLGLADDLGARVEPVVLGADGLLLARAFGERLFGLSGALTQTPQPEPALGDIFLGLDLKLHDVAGYAQTLHDLRSRGVRTAVVIYDLLPALMPENFPDLLRTGFAEWLRIVVTISDSVMCISRAVADELLGWLDSHPPVRSRPLDIGWFHLGADFRPAEADGVAGEHASLDAAGERPMLLMVGTIEPRKGHTAALDAMERLWARGVDAGLVIAGRRGWLMEGLEKRLLGHSELGRRLHWVADAGDALVAGLYRSCAALLMASEGEGFGLPLVEAANAGLPVITRDLPVFREICGEHALYFSGGADTIAAAVERWLALRREGRVPDPAGITTVTWEQASRSLAQIVLRKEWYARWDANSGQADAA